MHSLLESDCIPIGMELFPAADDDAWSVIKKAIVESDYYVLILAGRYGSAGPDGIGYTEMEYRYAQEQGKPIIAFLHKNPTKLSVERCDTDSETLSRLEAFRNLAKLKLVKYWETPQELGATVGRSIEKLKRDRPSGGWVKGDVQSSNEEFNEVSALYKKISMLEHQLKNVRRDISERPEVLLGTTYKIKTPLSDHALYVTINDVVLNEGTKDEYRRPFEIMINSTNLDYFQWVTALTKFISLSFRKGTDLREIAGELKSIFDPRGGYWKPGGKFMPSVLAEIGGVIEQHGRKLGLLSAE